ncbi:fimbrial protein [Glaciimonas sp. CA11.2]|uniref:fimbrial protein n=1 Tax=unclassified Glaciimonas TaxID=2644401 RepID=UPI002AB405F3|nr:MULTISPECIES: fimbrial protein [unclassified Glaciimonas]MDY7546340.1 fimbrial protein [Glaciimonas sp. CA11.2]MEB0010711.1 fimbrial protein [Glaciimonas sp. Cout2]MEB0082153.1 fimbrial protein [Glaciimonas sp. Gout2]MEB0163442.1 fimbrial protein [Glaciimonas sp. CA11.2]
MKLKLAATIVTLTFAGIASQSAMAAGIPDGQVAFSGKIEATTCTNKGMNYVNLGTLALSDASMKKPGDKGINNRFYIDLENCDTTAMKNATVQFSGTTDSIDAALLAVDVGNGKGQGVGVQIMDVDGASILGADSRAYPLLDGVNKLPFDARFVRTMAEASQMIAGDVTAVAQFNITYK